MSRLAIAAALVLSLAAAPALAQTQAPPPPPPAEQAVAPPPLTQSDAATQARAEKALRTIIGQLSAGAPDFTTMSPEMKEGMGPQVEDIHGALVELGALKAVSYEGATPDKAEVFHVTFEKGETDWLIHLTPEGKIDGLFFHGSDPEPAPAPAH